MKPLGGAYMWIPMMVMGDSDFIVMAYSGT
jgi:hypothetical protein